MQAQQVDTDETKLPEEYLELKKIQVAAFGNEYKYQQDKAYKEILVEVLCEKHVGLRNGTFEKY